MVGAEAMFDGLPNTRNTIGVTGGGPAAGSAATATINNRWITTATGKLGYAWDRVLLYGRAVSHGSVAMILGLRSMGDQPRSPAPAVPIWAGRQVSALSGRLPSAGQCEPNTILLG